MGGRLQLRVARGIILLILIIISVMGVFLTWQFDSASKRLHQVSSTTLSNVLMQQLNQRGVEAAVYMSDTLTNAIYSYDMEQMNQLISSITKQQDVVQFHVFDKAKKILHDGSELINTFGQNIPEPISSGLSQTPNNVYTVKKDNQMIFAKNVFIGEDKIGGVIITLSLDRIRDDIEILNGLMAEIDRSRLRSTLISIASIAVLLVIISSFLAWKITSKIVEPIIKLSEYASYIGSGNYDFEIELSGKNDELTALGLSFDKMKNSLKKSSSQISPLAHHDALTDLPNRRLFKQKLEFAIHNSKKNKTRFSLLFIDIDNFKNVNDNLGHDVGDSLLIEVAERLKHSVHSSEQATLFEGCEATEIDSTIARLGGDEFTIILFNIEDPLIISHIAQQVISDLSIPYKISSHTAYVGASIGISTYPDDGASSSVIMKNADVAMYHAKSSGKNQFQFYSTEINRQVMDDLEVENDLRLAIELEQFLLYYQPKLDLQDRKVTSVEALIRWKHPEKGYISPANFISIAEDTGLIIPIGEWVIETACLQLKHWQSTHINTLAIAINISAIQFKQADLDKIILNTLDKYELPYHLLEIEVTETAFIDSEKAAIRILSQLSKAGIKVWMDDFGTGYSSLGYLRQLPIYGVKIDYSFIRQIHKEENDRKLCQAIISMAHSLGLKVVAEGIEEIAQENIIKRLGCDYTQGFLYSKGIPAKELLESFFDTFKQ